MKEYNTTRRTLWIAIIEWLKWRPRQVVKICRVCGKEQKIWTTGLYYTTDICSAECNEEWEIERDREERGTWEPERDRKE